MATREGVVMKLLVRAGVVASLVVSGSVLVGRAVLMPAERQGQAVVRTAPPVPAQPGREEWDDPAVLHVGTAGHRPLRDARPDGPRPRAE